MSEARKELRASRTIPAGADVAIWIEAVPGRPRARVKCLGDLSLVRSIRIEFTRGIDETAEALQ